jgi:predicted peptidase
LIVQGLAVRALFAAGITMIFAISADARKHETGFLDRTLTLMGTQYKFQVFVPEDWTPQKKWPVILFLHGAGERGTDGLKQTEAGLPQDIRLHRNLFPAVVVIPQCPPNHWWSVEDMQEVALAVLAAASREFHGDANRTYLTGLSMGGYGTWAIAAKNPGKFAAIVPICGGITAPRSLQAMYPEVAKNIYQDVPESYAEVAQKIGKTPVWMFHGAKDDVVTVELSRKMYAALQKAGGDVRYTEYPEAGHDSWTKAYAEPEFPAWLLSKTLNK